MGLLLDWEAGGTYSRKAKVTGLLLKGGTHPYQKRWTEILLTFLLTGKMSQVSQPPQNKEDCFGFRCS